jgi:soluble lytic murein transglycosylase-like protein
MGIYGFKSETTKIKPIESDSTEYIMNVNYPHSLQMYYAIEKYSEKYKIPKQYAYGIAYKETEYRSPFQWGYNANRISPTGALGPMQVLLSTAKLVWKDKRITREKMLYNIDFNVETSIKYLKTLYNIYGDWQKALGCYNTGQPIVNSYAMNVYKHNN